jgi:preprotein translocase subunit SecF
MKVIDYENLFTYMSLIFAIGIFVIVLYGCAFASIKPSQVFENFEVKEDLKKEILPLLKEYENKGTDEDKKLISELIIKVENKTITVADLTSLIDLLKKLSSEKVGDKVGEKVKEKFNDKVGEKVSDIVSEKVSEKVKDTVEKKIKNDDK